MIWYKKRLQPCSQHLHQQEAVDTVVTAPLLITNDHPPVNTGGAIIIININNAHPPNQQAEVPVWPAEVLAIRDGHIEDPLLPVGHNTPLIVVDPFLLTSTQKKVLRGHEDQKVTLQQGDPSLAPGPLPLPDHPHTVRPLPGPHPLGIIVRLLPIRRKVPLGLEARKDIGTGAAFISSTIRMIVESLLNAKSEEPLSLNEEDRLQLEAHQAFLTPLWERIQALTMMMLL